MDDHRRQLLVRPVASGAGPDGQLDGSPVNKLARFKLDLQSRVSPVSTAAGMKPITHREGKSATARAAFQLGIATERGEQAYHYHLEKRK